jgi:hypothetical protein
VLFGEDQVTASGTLLKAEVPMTHLESQVRPNQASKKGKGGPWGASAEVGAVVGGGRGLVEVRGGEKGWQKRGFLMI